MADQEADSQPQEQTEEVAPVEEETPQQNENQSNEAPAPEAIANTGEEAVEEQAQETSENADSTQQAQGDTTEETNEDRSAEDGEQADKPAEPEASGQVEVPQDASNNALTEETAAEEQADEAPKQDELEDLQAAPAQDGEEEVAPADTEQQAAGEEEPAQEEQAEPNADDKGDEAPGDAPAPDEAQEEQKAPEGDQAAVTEEVVTEGQAPEGDAAPAEDVAQETTQEEAAPVEAAPQEAAPEEAAQEAVVPQEGDAPAEEGAPAQEQAAADTVQAEEKPAEEAPAPPVEQPASPTMVETDTQEVADEGQKVALSPRRPGVNLEATATVKFVLMPSGQVVTLANTLGQTLGELKAHFASQLKMPTNLIMLMFDGKGMSESTTLADLGVGPNGTVQLEMQSADPVNNPLKPYRPRQEYHMPDVITVRVMTEDCEAKDVVVEIERSRSKKPFLGGFRNKNTGVEYHNASAQTMQKPRPPPTTERFCRDTQTCEQRNIRQQTTNTTSTQMTGIGVYVSNAEDKLITPGKYFTADDYWSMILRNVIILQKYYRRWLAKRYVKKLKEDKARRLEWERQEELRKKKEKEDRIKRDYARRINPKTKADFDMLIHCLEKWRKEEMERINTTLTGAERKAAMCMLLDQETELLAAIERHKNEANTDNKEKRIMAFLEKAAAPKKWQGHDGNLTFMDTPYTIRAKELRDIYNSINMKYLTQDERLDVLLTLKHTVKEHDCKLTQEIIELIDREADLLMRGVKESNLTGLRKRISTLFLQYIKTPTFNPEAAKLLKVPQDPSTLRKDINYCHSCGSYLPSTEFFITINSKNVGRCRRCQKIENDGRQREDHTYYKVMLKALRKSEEAMQDGSSICYLLQEHDLRYLVENIWSNQSVLSAWNDLYDLVLVRWDKHQEWSPWNCILLTHDEAEAHKKLFNLEEGYGHVFIHKVTQKHNFARNYFSRLPGMSEVLRQKMGSRDLDSKNGPSVAGHSVPTKAAQKV